MSGLFADISKAGVETEPGLFESVGWRIIGRTHETSETNADDRVVERTAQQITTIGRSV